MTYKRTVNFVFLKACEEVLGEGCTNRITMNYSIGNSTFCEFSLDDAKWTTIWREKSRIKCGIGETGFKDRKISYNTFEARKDLHSRG